VLGAGLANELGSPLGGGRGDGPAWPRLAGDAPEPGSDGLLALAGLALGFGGQYEAGQERVAAALGLAETVGDRLVQARALSMAATFHWAYSEFGQAVDTGLRAALMLKDAGALWDYATP
jgi:hypothetical protein